MISIFKDQYGVIKNIINTMNWNILVIVLKRLNIYLVVESEKKFSFKK